MPKWYVIILIPHIFIYVSSNTQTDNADALRQLTTLFAQRQGTTPEAVLNDERRRSVLCCRRGSALRGNWDSLRDLLSQLPLLRHEEDRHLVCHTVQAILLATLRDHTVGGIQRRKRFAELVRGLTGKYKVLNNRKLN